MGVWCLAFLLSPCFEVGFFAMVFSAIGLCPWNVLFGAFTSVWIGVAMGSILEEASLLQDLLAMAFNLIAM